ncbi:MAG: hypothetical protein WC965_01830 [Thiohalomonadaceae bacterium]
MVIKGLNNHVILTPIPNEELWGVAVTANKNLGISPGDNVLFAFGSYYEFSVEGTAYIAVPEADVVALVST